MKRPVVLLSALVAASALALAGCSSSATSSPSGSASAGGTISVVASTNVYGDIVKTIGGDHVEVTSLIADESKDPHEFEATAADQLDVQNAQLLIENGGGYDPFMASLKDAAKSTAPLISAVTFSPEWTGSDPTAAVDGFNEHVFYDPQTIAAVADEIAKQLGTLDPADASVFTANATRCAVTSTSRSRRSWATSPRPTAARDLRHRARAAVPRRGRRTEERHPARLQRGGRGGQDVPPATLLDALTLIGGGSVKILFVNAQAAGAETTQAEAKAAEAKVPSSKPRSCFPEGQNYVSWMTDMATQIKTALGS
jgi:zinc/manganese transport system substrate-binding protein